MKAFRPVYLPIPLAGTLVWTNFDRHGLLDLVWKMRGQFVANIDDVRPQFQVGGDTYLSQNAIFNSTLVRANGIPLSATINDLNGEQFTSVSGFKQVARPWYSDQILPFDITLAGASEYGACTAMKIFGVEILNEGSGVSIDDPVTEMQATFVARFVEPWQAVASPRTIDLVLRGWVRNLSLAGEGGRWSAGCPGLAAGR